MELYCLLHLGEAELETLIEEKCHIFKPHQQLDVSTDDFKEALSYLSAAATGSKKSKQKCVSSGLL